MAQKQNKQPDKKPRIIRINLSWLYIVLLVGIGFLLFRNSGAQPEKVEWAQVQEMFSAGDIKDIHFVRNDFKGTVTIKSDRLDKYASLFPGGRIPESSPHLYFFTSNKFDPENEFAKLNSTLPQDGQVKIIMENDYDTPDGTCIRDFIHVVDLARAHVLALEYSLKNKGCEVINIGTGNGYSVLEVVKAYEKASGKKLKIEMAPRRAGDIAVSFADVSKAAKLLGFKTEFDIVNAAIREISEELNVKLKNA